MRWVEGDWTSEFWARLYNDSSKLFPYDTEGYADSIGVQWGAIIAKEIALPIAYRKVFGLKSGYLPFGIQQWGPIGKLADDTNAIYQVINSIPRNFTKVDISLHCPQDWKMKKDGWHFNNFRLQRWSMVPNYEIELTDNYEKNYNLFSKQTKRNIRSSLKYELSIFENDTPDILLQEFSRNQGKRYSIPNGFNRPIRQAMYHLLHKGKGAVWTVYGPGNCFHAGAFVAFSANRMVLLFSAISQEGRESNAMTYLINELILFGSGRWDIFDFEGSKKSGLSRFYSGFGASLSPYIRYQRWAIL